MVTGAVGFVIDSHTKMAVAVRASSAAVGVLRLLSFATRVETVMRKNLQVVASPPFL